MKILIISNHYPHGENNEYIFVKQLVDKWVLQGHECTVISPESLTTSIKNKRKLRGYITTYKVSNDKSYKLYSPKFMTFSNFAFIKKLANKLFNRAVMSTVKKNEIEFDLIYSHFLSQAGAAAYECSVRYQKPFFIAFGESEFKFQKDYSRKMIQEIFNSCSGCIAVSNEMKERLLDLPYKITENKISVHSNGFDKEKFHNISKSTVRNELKVNEEDFVVIFVGSFIERKGIKRVSSALESINNPKIKAVFIGDGPQKPNYRYTIFSGKVNHDNIVKWLNASDVFALPTLNEGSCNAIIEAMACGLPIISSDRPFNDDILDPAFAIRIDSMDIVSIKEAILKLYNDNLLKDNMSRSALEASTSFNLTKRATNILSFLERKASE
ncbi:glycosyltransferase [Halobacillus sp. B29]|uniref:glycosyltransferase n=1 Tax=Halobacillus sp. B29 TaxID=3457432 RepID=UPI003FCDC91C